MSNKHDFKDIITNLRSKGYSVTRTKNNHFKIQHPNLKESIFTSSTPSDWRSGKNLIAEVKRKMKV